jgi:hypothetical protein
LRYDNTAASTASFMIKNNILAMYAKWFIEVPPRERTHWLGYQIQSEQGLQ